MKMRKLLIILCFSFMILVLAGCGMGGSGDYSNKDSAAPSGSDPYSKVYDDDYSAVGGYDSSIASGQLTSKAWSDNENYNRWLQLITPDENNQSEHYLAKECQTFLSKSGRLYSQNMVKVVVTKGEVALGGARIEAIKDNGNAEEILFKGVTDNFGICYLFLNSGVTADIKLAIYYGNQLFNYTIDAIPEDRTVNINLDQVEVIPNAKQLDLCIVFDTTGSMGDELEYLKVELRNVLENVSAKTDFDINLALIFYRDDGDEYVTKVYGFTNDLATQYANLGYQSAKGGGDWPESVEVALVKANELQWRSNSVKILIDVLDAPLHDSASRCTTFTSQIEQFAAKGIRVIPVIASNSNKYSNLLEFTMRSAALLTGGVYTYLTNDSGIGNHHDDPSTSDGITVEYLNKMLVRLIIQYCTGVRQDPESYYQHENQTPTQNDEQVIVSFDSAGGSPVNSQLVDKGGKVNRPIDPTYDGYQFVGWFYSKNGEITQFDFDQPITEAITLTAVWLKLS